jgi:hypothetical protein
MVAPLLGLLGMTYADARSLWKKEAASGKPTTYYGLHEELEGLDHQVAELTAKTKELQDQEVSQRDKLVLTLQEEVATLKAQLAAAEAKAVAVAAPRKPAKQVGPRPPLVETSLPAVETSLPAVATSCNSNKYQRSLRTHPGGDERDDAARRPGAHERGGPRGLPGAEDGPGAGGVVSQAGGREDRLGEPAAAAGCGPDQLQVASHRRARAAPPHSAARVPPRAHPRGE